MTSGGRGLFSQVGRKPSLSTRLPRQATSFATRCWARRPRPFATSAMPAPLLRARVVAGPHAPEAAARPFPSASLLRGAHERRPLRPSTRPPHRADAAAGVLPLEPAPHRLVVGRSRSGRSPARAIGPAAAGTTGGSGLVDPDALAGQFASSRFKAELELGRAQGARALARVPRGSSSGPRPGVPRRRWPPPGPRKPPA
jgi:hypothetical protein